MCTAFAHLPIVYITAIILGVIVIVSKWILYQRQNERGVAAIIPIYNGVVFYRIAWNNGWLYFLSLLPIGGLIMHVMTTIKFAREHKKGKGFAMGLLFLPHIFFPILCYSGRVGHGIEIIHPDDIGKRETVRATLLVGGSCTLLLIATIIIGTITSPNDEARQEMMNNYSRIVVGSLAAGEWGIIPELPGETGSATHYSTEDVEELLEGLFLPDGQLDLQKISDLMGEPHLIYGGVEWSALRGLLLEERVSYYHIIEIVQAGHQGNNSKSIQRVVQGQGREVARYTMESFERYNRQRAREPQFQEEIRCVEDLVRRTKLLGFLGELTSVHIRDFSLEEFDRQSGDFNAFIIYQEVRYPVLGSVFDSGDLIMTGTSSIREGREIFGAPTDVMVTGLVAELLGINRLVRGFEIVHRLYGDISNLFKYRDEIRDFERTFVQQMRMIDSGRLRASAGDIWYRGIYIWTPSGERLLGLSLDIYGNMVALAGIERDLGLTREEAILGVAEGTDYRGKIVSYLNGMDIVNYVEELNRTASANVDLLGEMFSEMYPELFGEWESFRFVQHLPLEIVEVVIALERGELVD